MKNYLENPHLDQAGGLDNLLAEAKVAAKKIKQSLQKADCPQLGDLFIKLATCRKKRNVRLFSKQGWVQKDKKELTGLYVFGEEKDGGEVVPVYVGISRNVYRRLGQHGWGKLSNEATLAHLMAKH